MDRTAKIFLGVVIVGGATLLGSKYMHQQYHTTTPSNLVKYFDDTTTNTLNNIGYILMFGGAILTASHYIIKES